MFSNFQIKIFILKLINKAIFNTFSFSLVRRTDTSFSNMAFLFDKSKHFTLVDCGAYQGEFTQEAMKYSNSFSAICIEPSPSTFAILKKRFENESYIDTYNIAASNKVGSLTFYINNSEKTNSVLESTTENTRDLDDFQHNIRTIIVESDTLDSIFLKSSISNVDDISMLKIDTQGYEMNVLRGASNVLKKTRYILIEVHFVRTYKDSSTFFEIKSYLEQQGFTFLRFYDLVHSNSSREELIYGDALFKNKQSK